MATNHTLYDNFVLENKLEDLLTTNLDLNQFATHDDSLVENPGMVKKIHTYTSTGDVEELEMGEGNSQGIQVSFTEKEYRVGTTQGMFEYYDEQEMTDPLIIDAGLDGLAKRMTNNLTGKIVDEYEKAELVYTGTAWKFGDFVDAIAMYPYEGEEGLFCLINPAQKASIRKSLADDLKYVEDFARTGYIGSVCGVPIYVSKAVPAGEAFLATKEAITIYTKKGNETEQTREPNIRKNTVFARKVMLVALTDATRVIKITDKNWVYTEVSTPDVDEIGGYFERSGEVGAYVYTKTTDTALDANKTYYTRELG